MNEEKLLSLVEKYRRILLEDPRSPLFAPLADALRQLKNFEESIGVLKKGIRFNPNYVPGYFGLAQIYIDMGEAKLAYSTLRPLIGGHRDNIKMQKAFGNVCLELEYFEEALDTFKFLLFIAPKDKYLQEQVKILEDRVSDLLGEDSIFIPSPSPLFEIENLTVGPPVEEPDADEWVQVQFEEKNKKDKDEAEGWEQNRPEPMVAEEVPEEKSGPVITHTLVELYIQQGHIDKAKEVLAKILEINPDDPKTLELRDSLERDFDQTIGEQEGVDEGRGQLMDLFDKSVGHQIAMVNHAKLHRLKKLQKAFNARRIN